MDVFFECTRAIRQNGEMCRISAIIFQLGQVTVLSGVVKKKKITISTYLPTCILHCHFYTWRLLLYLTYLYMFYQRHRYKINYFDDEQKCIIIIIVITSYNKLIRLYRMDYRFCSRCH